MEVLSDTITPFTARDLDKVFAYSHAPATVITLWGSQEKIVEHKCVTEDDWDILIRELPSIRKKDEDSGFVLLMTPHISGRTHTRSPTVRDGGDEKNSQIRRETDLFETEESIGPGGQRKPRLLPFSQDVFSKISKAFYMHRSVSAAINRADVPLFSYEDIALQDKLGEVRAIVYTCRSTNAWGSDLAMTVTHFPHCRLSFGVLFGCSEPQKKYVIQRLHLAIKEASHPLLLPGLFVEIEKKRHHIIFEAGVTRLESMIPELDPEALIGQEQSANDSDRQAKQSIYLDMLYLKHGLTTWSQQLNKMLDHAQTLSDEYAGPWSQVSGQTTGNSSKDSKTAANPVLEAQKYGEDVTRLEDRSGIRGYNNFAVGRVTTDEKSGIYREILVITNQKIIKRIQTILEDYRDKIGECQIRFDGLAMTTQLVSIYSAY
ncbi:hypothetical protein F5B17DRAFT_412796 [Nemania serpens]|nr:hypothetical protein F5B17DRAFT_412796 [Nemania serpens]